MNDLDWWQLLGHFLSLSLLGVGGAITTVPEMHRFLVDEHHWLTQAQFTSSIALAQAAPGPNVTYIALLGWNTGLNAAAIGSHSAWISALLCALLAMFGTLAPTTALTLLAARWGQRNRERLSVRAFKAGMAPLVVALLVSTGWILATHHDTPQLPWQLCLLSATSAVLAWRARLHVLWLLGAGALLGWFGLV